MSDAVRGECAAIYSDGDGYGDGYSDGDGYGDGYGYGDSGDLRWLVAA